MRNIHLPLPEEVCVQLGAEAERMKRPATAVAREGMEAWLRTCRKLARQQAIAEFAGTEYDLDAQLEAAGTEHLDAGERKQP